MKIYAIEVGDYSDYHIAGVYDSKDKAQFIIDKLGYGTIAEWKLNAGLDEINNGLKVFRVFMLKDGNVESIKELEMNEYDFENNVFIWERSKAAFYRNRFPESEDCINATVWAKDEKHAIKIVNEKRSEFIALNKW